MSSILFICCTPYQIFNSINYNLAYKSKNDKYDMLICNHFKGSSEIAIKCRNTKIWNKCYHMKTEYHRTKLKTMVLIHNLDFSNMIEGENDYVWDYDEVFIGTYNNISSIIAYKYCKKNMKPLSIIDEGIGSYNIDKFINSFPRKQRLFRKISDHVLSPRNVNKLVLYRPEWYCGKLKLNIEKLPLVDRKNIKLVDLISYVFEHDRIDELSTVIIFDQPVDSPEIDEVTYKSFLKHITECVENSIIKDDYSIKWHPRTSEDFKRHFDNNTIKVNSAVGWETFLLDMKVIKRRIYLTIVSSAAFLSSMIFGDGDIIIFLYKMLHMQVPNIDAFIDVLISDGTVIYTPSSFEELKEVLEISFNSVCNT